MISLFSYLITFFGALFWVFRVIVALLYQLDIEFFAEPLNLNTEILVLFLTIPCFLLVLRRNIIGAAAYLALYFSYFGTALYNIIMQLPNTGLTLVNSSDILLLSVGLLIPLLTFLDIMVNKNRVGFHGDKKTDWFYTNKAYDRQFDERADKNQYRNMK